MFQFSSTVFLIVMLLSTIGCWSIRSQNEIVAAEALIDSETLQRKEHVGLSGISWWVLKKIAIKFIGNEEPEAAYLIEGVKEIRVATYVIKDMSLRRKKEVVQIYNRLLAQNGWDEMARVRKEDEIVTVHALASEDAFKGLFVVSIEGNEMNVVKLAGKFDLTILSQLDEQMDGKMKFPLWGRLGKKKEH